MISPARTVAAQQELIVWSGDLQDDCLARWAGLLLRAEWIEDDHWWWAVYEMQAVNEPQIDSSNNYDTRWTSGEQARSAAEAVAKRYLLVPID